MFNKTRSPAPATPDRPSNAPPIPPLPDLPSPGMSRSAAPAPAPSPIASSRGLSTLSSDLQFEGNVSGAGDLQVDGSVKGDVRVGRLIVGETGAIEGNVAADYLEVRGRIVGAVNGKQVKLVSTAYVDGDITAEQLSIDIGAYFQGRVLQSRREAPAPVAPAPRPAAPAPASEFEAPPAPVMAATPIEDKPQIIDLKSV
ncbi:bactofilin family protein [Brevundimonas sp.]|uniref:bactofilin family protein n=1 Tax=Brevundimonas sp. TaxID=1871086 RepID=UPI003D0C0784